MRSVLVASAMLAGCTASKPAVTELPTGRRALDLALERTGTCLVRRDPTFRRYRIADERDSYSGRPRFLLVERNDTGGLPQLVVEGAGRQLTVYGPLADAALTGRIRRWGSGDRSC